MQRDPDLDGWRVSQYCAICNCRERGPGFGTTFSQFGHGLRPGDCAVWEGFLLADGTEVEIGGKRYRKMDVSHQFKTVEVYMGEREEVKGSTRKIAVAQFRGTKVCAYCQRASPSNLQFRALGQS